MASNPAIEIASTLQAAHIKRSPDPAYDANPATAASKKTPVRFRSSSSTADAEAEGASDEIPVSVLEAPPRQHNLPPLPDLRFEQSYLARIAKCQTWYSVAWTTFVDQVVLPLGQGVVWNLALHGWRAWNTHARFHGRTVGARLRRWWWGVNNWAIPSRTTTSYKP